MVQKWPQIKCVTDIKEAMISPLSLANKSCLVTEIILPLPQRSSCYPGESVAHSLLSLFKRLCIHASSVSQSVGCLVQSQCLDLIHIDVTPIGPSSQHCLVNELVTFPGRWCFYPGLLSGLCLTPNEEVVFSSWLIASVLVTRILLSLLG